MFYTYLNNRWTGTDATKPRALGLLGHSVYNLKVVGSNPTVGKNVPIAFHAWFAFIAGRRRRFKWNQPYHIPSKYPVFSHIRIEVSLESKRNHSYFDLLFHRWLLRDRSMKVRSNYPGYTQRVEIYFKRLLSEVVDLQVNIMFMNRFDKFSIITVFKAKVIRYTGIQLETAAIFFLANLYLKQGIG